MIMRRYIYALTALTAAFLSVQVSVAQDLDPTVEVSRAYEGKLMEVHKPVLKMAVPDSVLRFDLDFDYSVFESPYRGSYEFNPYAMTMRPTTAPRRQKCFYLRAGAGYALHPTLDLIWSPRSSKAFDMDVYAMHRSYIGEYRSLDDRLQPTGEFWNGNDLRSKAGADFHFDWRKARLDFGAGYYGLHRKDLSASSGYNALDLHARVRSKSSWPEHFLYDFSMKYRLGGDRMQSDAAVNVLREHAFNFDMRLAPSSRGVHNVYFDVALELDAYSGFLETVIGEFAFVPHYSFRYGIMDLDLGVRLAKLMRGDGGVTMYKTREQFVYPDVTMRFDVVRNVLNMYLRAGGGNGINTYSSLLEDNHHLNMTFGRQHPLLDTTVERLSLILGFEGRISSRFSYNLRGGYVNYKNDVLAALAPAGNETEDASGGPGILPAVGYAAYQKGFISLDWRLKTERVSFEGGLEYVDAWGDPFEIDEASGLFRPASLTGDVSFKYNFKRRIFAGIDYSFSTAREAFVTGFSDACRLPGYADLGLGLEYAAGSRFSVWLRGGNLLNMNIQRNPLYAERGINFTAGICLSF